MGTPNHPPASARNRDAHLALPIHGIALTLRGEFKSVRCGPGNQVVKVTCDGGATRVEMPPLELHAMVVAES